MKTGIALFVYNRPLHTQKVLEGLKKNHIAKLYIFADGLKTEEHRQNHERVRNLVDSIDWCETEIVKHSENKGLAESVIYGVNYVLDRHERIIALEDDCVPAPNYIDFMEECFDTYEGNENVMSVSGYSWPINKPDNYNYDIYFAYRLSSWGWGTWRRAWKYFNRDQELLKKIKESYQLYMKVNRAGRDLFPMFEKEVNEGLDSWAVYWAINIALHDGVCINPIKSRIRNIGFDGSGVHMTSADNRFDTQLIPDHYIRKGLPQKVAINGGINYQLEQILFQTISNEGILKKYKDYYLLMNKWLNNVSNGKKIINYLNSIYATSIAIYGMGELGKNVFDELRKEHLNIICIDQNTIDKLNDHDVDVIIITPIYDFDVIKKNICSRYARVNIVSLATIINNLESVGANLNG